MYSTRNEGKSVIPERSIRTLKRKICENVTSYLGYLNNKLVDKYNNRYHYSIGKKPIDDEYSALPEKVEANSKLTKLVIEPELQSTRIFSAKVTLKIDHKKYLSLILR